MRPLSCIVNRPNCCYFNPRTHEGCDTASPIIMPIISKFQSTHPRGVRHEYCVENVHGVEFQSTHPRGVRLCIRRNVVCASVISIHAPTRGATFSINYSMSNINNFNPRTHEGCDLQFLHPHQRQKLFQSTHPRGVRHELLEAVTLTYDISIHAPTRGAT